MILAHACPRCRGALSRVMDIGEIDLDCHRVFAFACFTA